MQSFFLIEVTWDRVIYHYGSPHSLSIIHLSLFPSLLSLLSPSFPLLCILLHLSPQAFILPSFSCAPHPGASISSEMSFPPSTLHCYFPPEMHIPKLNFSGPNIFAFLFLLSPVLPLYCSPPNRRVQLQPIKLFHHSTCRCLWLRGLHHSMGE